MTGGDQSTRSLSFYGPSRVIAWIAALALLSTSAAAGEGRKIVPLKEWTFTPDQSTGSFPWSLASIGDVNGDGYSDFAFGDGYWTASLPYQGRVFAFYGSPSGPGKSPDWVLDGDQAQETQGIISGAGDVNGDGYDDVLVGSIGYDRCTRCNEFDHGRVRLFLGSASGLANVPAWSVVGAHSGDRLASGFEAGDVNGDGFGDVVIDGIEDFYQSGTALLYLGSAAGLGATPSWTRTGDGPHWLLGAMAAGDVNGDGYDDVVAAAPGAYAPGTYIRSGYVQLYSGSPNGLSTTPAWISSGFTFDGLNFGSTVLRGDSNGDGYADLAIGVAGLAYPSPNGGAVSVFFGGPNGPNVFPDWTAFASTRGEGASHPAWADVDGDHHDDLVVGSDFYSVSPYDVTGEGRVRLYMSAAPTYTGLTEADHPSWVRPGAEQYEQFGANVAAAGDVDGDGREDLLIASRLGTGAIHLVYGFLWRDPPKLACPQNPLHAECFAGVGAAALDASASYDPFGGALTWDWSSASCSFSDASAPATVATCGLGENVVTLTAKNDVELASSCDVPFLVEDTTPPAGGITAPAAGACFPPSKEPILIEDDFQEACFGDFAREYAPEGGPLYQGHGDHDVLLHVIDPAGNFADSSVAFTIDGVPPTVAIDAPDGTTVLRPERLPFAVVFHDADDDGAAGAVVHELVKLQGCTLYDGSEFGDRDGLLSDEALLVGAGELCRLAAKCGLGVLSNPELSVEATDCAGNRAVASRHLTGTIALRPGLCGK